MSSLILATAHIKGPHIDWAGLSPIAVLGVGALVVLLVGLAGQSEIRTRVVPALALLVLAGAIGTEIWRFTHAQTIIAGALRIDDLALIVDLVCAVSAVAAVLLSWRDDAPRAAGHGEFHALLLFSVMGMAVLISAQDIITLFLGLELLSIPLYILCAAEYRREGSLESGLKYLIIGSVGSATLLYGLAMIYGATGQTGFNQIAQVLAGSGPNGNLLGDPMLLSGIALVVVGFAFKASVAPFHQWTPDVYEGAPTAITAFMATATKAAALAVFLRFFDVAVISEQTKWAPALAALATATILIGNVGALGQTSLKRLLGYSGVAQAGYMLSGVIVGTRLGISATILYVIAYLLMNIAAFAVIQHQQYASGDDRVSGLAGLGKRSPVLGWSITLAMLALAGVPGTIGFIGKFQLIHALVDGGYGWLAIVLVVGAMISLGYYLRVVAAVWMSPEGAHASIGASAVAPGACAGAGAIAPIAGGSQEADKLPYPEVAFVAALFAAATVFFGVIPGPLFHLASHAGAALTSLF
ncbi:MAG TPA: NADH-quinone oxidoreductase subunit N [Solirubrobacteraceae bacterium]|nr:NADH-quinone oxidoreductase subunit N [Solirubrobacteraceae bacterium]